MIFHKSFKIDGRVPSAPWTLFLGIYRAPKTGRRSTVIDLSNGYQSEVSQIKAQNPQVLWPKLTKEYYDAKIATLANKPGFWEAYMQGMMGDPAQQIRFMQSLLLPNLKWKVTETRSDQVQDSIQFGRYDRTIVYVTVTYPTLNDSPFVDGKFLKETILEFDVNAKSQLVMALGRLAQGDTPWDASLMIMNISWQLERLAGSGHFRAEAIGGKAPYTWTPRCGSYDLSKILTRYDGLGRPIDQRNVPFLMVDLGRFPNNVFPTRCVVTVTDGAGQTDTVGITVPKMLTGFNASCYVRVPWFSRGQGRPGQPTTCIEPVMATESATANVSPVEPPAPVAEAKSIPAERENAAAQAEKTRADPTYLNRDCEGAEGGQAGAVYRDLSQQNTNRFTVDLHPVVFRATSCFRNPGNTTVWKRPARCRIGG